MQVAPINSDIMEEYSSAGEAIKTVRTTINEGWRQILYTRDQIDYVVTTGKAHTEGKQLNHCMTTVICI